MRRSKTGIVLILLESLALAALPAAVARWEGKFEAERPSAVMRDALAY
jgi:hypothetical protein